MPADYNLLKNCLNLNAALEWLLRDGSDDFFVDPIGYADIRHGGPNYFERRKHRLFQLDSIPYWLESVPKKKRLLRDAIWLHPTHRLLYLGILHRLLPKLDPRLSPSVYSYRLDAPGDPAAYPFANRMDRWKQFYNDFRETVLAGPDSAVLITDLANFFDHINCKQLCDRIRIMLAHVKDDYDEAAIQLLQELLVMWSTDGFGIPQNHDPSSFFGSLYLDPVDKEMAEKRYRYYRWIDDVRIIAKNEGQAVRALHDLQRSLARYRLFLNSEKTVILKRGDPRLDALLDVEDDVAISAAEEALASRTRENITEMATEGFRKLEHHASEQGDDRKFRAFAHRLLEAGDFEPLRKEIHGKLRGFVIPRLTTHPERSDTWAKILRVAPDGEVTKAALQHLVTNPSLFDWQRFHLWRLVLHFSPPLPGDLLVKAKAVCATGLSDVVGSVAITCAGKFGDNNERELLFASHFTPQRSYLIQRSVLIAIQELPKELRTRLYDRAVQMNSDHRDLVEYLSSLNKANYGEKHRPAKSLRDSARKVQVPIKRGVGLVKGALTRFRMSRSDMEYE